MARGRFITLEGIEGAGKTTVAQAIKEFLLTKGLPVDLTREPGGTPFAETLREQILHPGEESIDSVAETLLMFAARAVHLSNRIRPALAAGTWVICDRFTDATRAYQGGGRGVDRHWIEALAEGVHAGCEPDLTLLLDLPVEQGLARARSRRLAAGIAVDDRFESESAPFFEKVRGEYLRLAAEPGSVMVRVDASASADSVSAAAVAVLAQRFAADWCG
jgi:dTMP kinase